MMRATIPTGVFLILVLLAATALGEDRYSGNGHYYRIITSSATWTSARSAAEAATYSGMKGHLITITSSGENGFVKSTLLSQHTSNFWIGAYQPSGSSEPSGGWTWVSGEPWVYTSWNPGEPNNVNGEDVAEFYTANGTWNDNNSASSKPYIIEFDPVTRILINSGESTTESTSATLTLDFESGPEVGAPQVRLRDKGGTWSSWQTFSSSVAWTLSSGDGTKTVQVEFKDDYGMIFADEDSIILDGNAPTGSVFINGGDAWTNSKDVSVGFSWSDGAGSGVLDMRSRLAGDTWSAWGSLTATKAWTLPSGDGTRTIEAQYRDRAGHESAVVGDSIGIDTIAPTIVEVGINDGAAYATGSVVTVTVTATDASSGIGKVRIRQDTGGASWTESDWEASGVFLTELAIGDGTRGVEVQVDDVAGNSSALGSDTIIVDGKRPELTEFEINSGRPYVLPGEDIEIAVFGDDTGASGLSACRVTFDGGSVWTPWHAVESGSSFLIDRPAAEGLVTARVVARDGAGNQSTGLDGACYFVESDLPAASGGGKLTGELSPAADVDTFAVELVAGDTLTVKLKAKAAVKKQSFLGATDLIGPAGDVLHEGRYPADAKKPGIAGYFVPETGRYLVVARRDAASEAQEASLKLGVKVKQNRANKKGSGTATNEDVTFEAADGSLLKGKLIGSGLEQGQISLFGPGGDVVLELKGKTGKWTIPTTTLTAGTGTYTLRIGSPDPVKWKWAVKLPKKLKAVIED